jgi:hypothetical protein
LLLGLLFCVATVDHVRNVYAEGNQLSFVGIIFAATRFLSGIAAIALAGSILIRRDNIVHAASNTSGLHARSVIEQVLATFPDASAISGDDAVGFEASWAGDGISAGIRTHGKQITIFLGDAEMQVSTVSQAAELLRGIFEDRYVAVGGFKAHARVKGYIAPSDNISVGLTSPTHVYQGPIALPIDELRVRSWSGLLDAGEAFGR